MIHLITGGARSGKSRYAEQLAEQSNATVTVIATATAGDDEMKSRIEQHQAERPQDWQLIEEPFYLSMALNNINDNESVIIIDCLTLWLNNWLCSHDESSFEEEKNAFIDALIRSKNSILIVTNEVGSGIVPMGELSRQFVDQAGWLNQALAQLADKVSLVVVGCPIALKDLSQPISPPSTPK